MTQLVELLLLQGGQFVVLLLGVMAVNYFAGGEFLITEQT
jgi:hypothetical protein